MTVLTGLGRFEAGLAVVVCMSLGCIPSFPPNDSTGALDRSQKCHQDGFSHQHGDEDVDDEVPWPGFGADDDGFLSTNACGYPAGENVDEDADDDAGDYGFEEGDVFENLVLFNCEGDQVQIAQYLPQFGLANGDIRGVVFGVGALWCMPCRQEAEDWVEHFFNDDEEEEKYAGRIQFIQALDEGPVGLDSVTPQSCAGWSMAAAKDKFPILYDPNPQGLQSRIEGQSGAGIPYTLIFDTNARVRLKKIGGILDIDTLIHQIDELIGNDNGN